MADIKQKVLIVGGGFGGVKAAHVLAKDGRFDVTLISTDDELRYYPTLYLTATGGSRSNSSIPYSTIFEGLKLDLVKDEVVSLDRRAKTVSTTSGSTYGYDSLILAMGVVTNYFGIPGLQELSFSIKTQEEVARFKQHLHKQLDEDKKPDLNYVIVGAGPTGIELAGALPAYLKSIMRNHEIAERKIHIDLIEAGPKLLPMMPKSTSVRVEKQLKTLGVKLYLNSKVEGEDVNGLTVSGKPIKSHTVIWTAGVTNNPFFSSNGFAIMGRGKVGVDAYLQAELGIYVIGDNANTPFSGLAQTALYDGEFVAENLIRKVEDKDPKNYNPKKPISVIPSGPHWAAVVWGRKHFNGYLGYLVREAADLAGFHDLEPWPKATKQFFSKFSHQDNCEVCSLAMSKYQA
jgi:NADH dehydrogenase